MALPTLTDEQRKAALEKAAQARHARAELREKVKTGKVSLKEVLDSTDPLLSSPFLAMARQRQQRLWTSSEFPQLAALRALALVSVSSSSRH